jgi:fructose-1,6-bisphosphatase
VKDLEKRVNSLTVFVKDIVEIQQKMIERIKEVETKVIMMQNQQHLINLVSNISRKQPRSKSRYSTPKLLKSVYPIMQPWDPRAWICVP